MRRVPGQRCALRLRHGPGSGKISDVARGARFAGPEVMLLVDVPVEDGDVLPVLEQVDGLAAVLGGPVPRRRQVEERPVGEDNDGASGRSGLRSREPVHLSVADGACGSETLSNTAK